MDSIRGGPDRRLSPAGARSMRDDRASVAVFADVHGNLPALEAVLDDLDRQDVDEVLVGGDLVGRGPQGSEVVRRVRERGWSSIGGNHEEYLLSFRRAEVPAEWLHTAEWSASRWMAAQLDADDVGYIAGLPFSATARTRPGLRLVHGSPRSCNEGIGPWTPDATLTEHLGAIGETVLVCAHTHRPMQRELDGRLVVNVGAVGLPFNRDPRAQYAILDWSGERWSVRFRQVAYDRAKTLDAYRTSGFLAEGGVTAELLKMELEQAVPFLVPFLEWARALARPADRSEIPAFLEAYDPAERLDAFFRRLGR
jgi:predicted phosphodiesterase